MYEFRFPLAYYVNFDNYKQGFEFVNRDQLYQLFVGKYIRSNEKVYDTMDFWWNGIST